MIMKLTFTKYRNDKTFDKILTKNQKEKTQLIHAIVPTTRACIAGNPNSNLDSGKNFFS